jgi:DNA-binding NtrC family response regulator
VERDYIAAVLRTVRGNRMQAAAKLGIGAATLYRKLKALGDSAVPS